MRFQDTTTCGCAMPCRVGTFDVLSKLTNDDVEPGLHQLPPSHVNPLSVLVVRFQTTDQLLITDLRLRS